MINDLMIRVKTNWLATLPVEAEIITINRLEKQPIDITLLLMELKYRDKERYEEEGQMRTLKQKQ